MMVRWLLLVACACGAHQGPRNSEPPEAGITISLYRAGDARYGVVDERRWVDITGPTILLANIDPGATLASLLIEAEHPALAFDRCTRERLPDVERDPLKEFAAEHERLAHERLRRRLRRRMPNLDRVVEPALEEPRVIETARFAPAVRCDVVGPPGRHLVHIVYISRGLSYRVQHDVEMRDPRRASLTSRFAVITPPWRERADVIIYDGMPGASEAPREIVRGPVTLDGSTAVLVVPTREVAAHVRRIYEGAVIEHRDAEGSDIEDVLDTLWAGDAVAGVWATLELPGVRLAPGPTRVHVDVPDEDSRWIIVPPVRGSPRDPDAPLRLPLWIDDTLRATRQRQVIGNDGIRTTEAVTLAVTNVGDTAREVWMEERLRPAKRRIIERAWPNKPTATGDVVRNALDVRPGRTARAGYLVHYE